jgi:hypothetical protein
MRGKGRRNQTEHKKQQELLANNSCHQSHWLRFYAGQHFTLLVRRGLFD